MKIKWEYNKILNVLALYKYSNKFIITLSHDETNEDNNNINNSNGIIKNSSDTNNSNNNNNEEDTILNISNKFDKPLIYNNMIEFLKIIYNDDDCNNYSLKYEDIEDFIDSYDGYFNYLLTDTNIKNEEDHSHTDNHIDYDKLDDDTEIKKLYRFANWMDMYIICYVI
jgi:hypothetical protein